MTRDWTLTRLLHACRVCGCERDIYVSCRNCRDLRIRERDRAKRIAYANDSRLLITSETGCWIWLGKRTARGYGPYGRYYDTFKGAVPHPSDEERAEGQWMRNHRDHLCKTTACVNPYHLQVVRPSVNHRRSLNCNHPEANLFDVFGALSLHVKPWRVRRARQFFKKAA